MAAFDPAGADGDRAFVLMWNTPVRLYWRKTLLDEAVTWLRADGYQVVAFDAASWTSEREMHRDIAQALSFPDYYGHNLDALNDCLRDVVGHAYGWDPAATGLVLVFTEYDTFAGREPRAAQIVLDIIVVQSGQALLCGRRLICLAQSNDPKICFEPVGAVPVMWNDAEWLNAKRRP